MKSLIIWSDFLSLPTLYLLDGNYSRYNGIVINAHNEDYTKEQLDVEEILQEELNTLLYDSEGKLKLPEISTEDLLCDPDIIVHIVRCGIAP